MICGACSFNVPEESIQILNEELVVDDNLTFSVITMSTSAINDSSIHMDELKMPEESIQIMNKELMLDGDLASVDTASSAINNNCAQKDKYPNSLDNCIIVGWAIIVLLLGLVTFSFPYDDVPDYHFKKAFITYIVMLISELGIWIPLWTHMSPPRGHLKERNFFLRASFMIFNNVLSILEQIISSIHYLNHGRLLTFINLFYGVMSFFMVSTLFWLTIDLERDGVKWDHLSLGCNAALSATLLNISVFQLIVKKIFLHFPLFAILRDVIDLIDLIIRIVHNKEKHC